jgi:carboxyl-terminal processing protease
MKKRIISLLIAALMVVTVTVTPIFAITDEEAEALAFKLIQVIVLGNEYSTQPDGDGTIMAMYPALAAAIKKDPTLYDKLMDGYFANSDKYTKFYTADQFETNTYGKKRIGIGITFISEESAGKLVVQGVTKGSPAEKAGIHKGDTIIAVNGENIEKLSFDDAYAKLLTFAQIEGKSFTVTVLHTDGKTADVKITPAEIGSAVDSVVSGMIDLEDGKEVGYIGITNFLEDTPQYYQNALEYLEEKGIKSVIIDLRGNGGGGVDAVYEILNATIPGKLPMYTIVENKRLSIATSDAITDYNPDYVILTDSHTASASELFASVLQYHGIARVVGEKTYGKAIGQATFDLGDGSYFSITSLEAFLPNGKNWQGTGVAIDVKATDDLKTTDVDEALDAAVEILDDTGAVIKEPATYDFYFNGENGETYTDIAKVALAANPQWDKDVRFIFRSENGILLTMNCREAYAAVRTGWFTGFAVAQKYKDALVKAGYKDFELIASNEEDYGFDAKITLKTDVDAKYFYYWNPEDGTYEEFSGKPVYSGGVLTFTTRKGGLIIASAERIKQAR